MPKIRDVLIPLSIEIAQKKRKCHRNDKHSIEKNETCLVIKTGPYNARKNYCLSCADEILTKASTKLCDLRNKLNL